MLETIISWLASVVGELLDSFINMFVRCLHIDLGSFVQTFPMLLTGYKIFQSIGIGLVICIAGFQLFKFFTGQLSDIRDTPLQILLRAGIAGLMLWFGGNIIELCIDIAVIPFNAMSGANASEVGSFVALGESIRSNFGDMIGMEVTVGPAALLALSLIIMVLIGWNIMKLIIEVCERYLMIGVLAFSAPLVYPTITSKSTSNVFWKFVGMFLGQCAIMTLSIWFLKLILSGFNFTPDADNNIFFRFLLTLAMCKIAQRVDTYMQQLGIGVATTGGGLIDEAIGAVAMLSHMGGKSGAKLLGGIGGGGSSAVLGAGADGSLSRFGGLFGGLSNMTQRAFQQIKSGDNVSDVVGALGRNFSTGAGLSGAGKNIAQNAKEMANAFQNGDLKGGFDAMRKTAAAGASGAAGMAMSGAPANTAYAAAEARDASAAMGGMTGQGRSFDRAAAGAGGPVSAAMAGGTVAGAEAVRRAAMNHAKFGQQLSRYSPQYLDPNGSATMRNNTADLSGANQNVLDKFKDTHQTAAQFMTAQRAAYGVGGFEYMPNANGGFGDIRMDERAQAVGSRLVTNDGEVIHNFDGDANYDEGIGFSNVPHIEGSDENVGDFISSNYTAAANNAAANAVLKETVEGGNELMAEQALFNPYMELAGNDELGDALLKKGIGEENITGKTGGKFSDISVKTDAETGGRSIQCSYTDSNGEVSAYEIYDNASVGSIGAYQQAKDTLTHRMSSIETKATGQKIYKRSFDVQTETVSTHDDPVRSAPSGGMRTARAENNYDAVRTDAEAQSSFGTGGAPVGATSKSGIPGYVGRKKTKDSGRSTPNGGTRTTGAENSHDAVQPDAEAQPSHRTGGAPVNAAPKPGIAGYPEKKTPMPPKKSGVGSKNSMQEREIKSTGQKIYKRDIDVKREDI